jgi:hypothetical protein
LICALIGYMEDEAAGMRDRRNFGESHTEMLCNAAATLDEKADWARQELARIAEPERSEATQ